MTGNLTPEEGSKCYCADKLKDVVQCSDKEEASYIALTFCMTYDEDSQAVLVGSCPYFVVTDDVEGFWVPLPRNVSLIGEKLCASINREGLLCGRCVEGHGVSVYSNDFTCVNCQENPYGWAWFFFTEIILQTLFFLTVFFFRISVNTEKFNAFVLFCQIIISTRIDLILPDYLASIGFQRIRTLARLFSIFYKLWVLDFFTSVVPKACFHEDLDMLGAVALGYVSAFYPFLLILFASLLIRLRDCNFKLVTAVWKPYRKLKLMAQKYIDLNQSFLHTVSSFIVLSYSKFALVSYSLLFPTNVYNASGVLVFKHRWYHDAEIELFSSRHIPYGILALVVFVTFILAPPLLLILYPFKCFRSVLHKMRLDHPALDAFVDSFQGYYKDGTTHGSRDLRYFSALYFVLRLLFFGTRIIASYRWQLNIIVFIFAVAAILFAYCQPYKKGIYNVIDLCFLSLLALQFYLYSVFVTNSAITRDFPIGALFTLTSIASLPIIYFLAVLVYHLIRSVKTREKCQQWMLKYKRHRGRMNSLAEWPHRLVYEERSEHLLQSRSLESGF